MTTITQKRTERSKKLGQPFPEEIRAQFLGVCTQVHTHTIYKMTLGAIPSEKLQQAHKPTSYTSETGRI